MVLLDLTRTRSTIAEKLEACFILNYLSRRSKEEADHLSTLNFLKRVDQLIHAVIASTLLSSTGVGVLTVFWISATLSVCIMRARMSSSEARAFTRTR